MDEGEKMEWDLVPPDMVSSNLFFTEESYNRFSIDTDLTDQIINKYRELGPYSYANDKDLPEFISNKISETTPASQSVAGSSSGFKENGVRNYQENIKSNGCDAMDKGSYHLPESVAIGKSLDGRNTPEMPFTSENSVKSLSPQPSEEHSQNASYGRKRLQYPHYSSINNTEQKFYISKIKAYKKKQPEPNCPDYAKFLKLHKKVQKEQEEFTVYLRKASITFKEDYNVLQDVAAKYMQKKHEAILKNLQGHSSSYLPIDKVPMATNHCTTYNLQPVKLLLQMGEVPVSFPFQNRKMKTLLDYDILQHRFPTDRSDKTYLPFYCHQVCSDDSNAQKLAQKYQCNIVVSSSVLKCLVDNHAPHFEKSWDVPVSVQEYELEAPEKVPHKVVFIDKPFHRQQTTRDVNTTFHKISLAGRVLHPDHMSTHRFMPSSTSQNHSTSDVGGTNDIHPEESDLIDVSILETFGTSALAEKPIKEKRNSAEISSLENKRIKPSVCDTKDIKDLSKESVSNSVEVNLELQPIDNNGHKNTSSPQESSIIGESSGEKQSEEKSKINMISESSSENTGPCVPKEKSSEDEDSDSVAELVIHFESSDTDDVTSGKKSIQCKDKVLSKLPGTCRSKNRVNQVPYTPGSPPRDVPKSLPPLPTPDAPASPTPDAPASPTPDAPASPTPDAPASPTPDAPASPTPDAPASPTPDAPASPTPDAPASPTPDAPASPTPDAPASSTPDAPASPTPDAPASPTPDAPASPTPDAPASPTPDAPESSTLDTPASPTAKAPGSPSLSTKENFSQCFDRPMVIIPTDSDVNVFKFNDIEPKTQIISGPDSGTDTENASESTKRKHTSAFGLGPLDSILEKQEELLKTTTKMKAATAIPEMNRSNPKRHNNLPDLKIDENPENYLKPEKGNNVTYCIWNFGDLRLLVRCKYSAIRKYKKAKTEFVYLMPKVEYQAGFGLEQTTLSEASQMWISSLIRHNCTINRIRINAFTSDILMEETLSFQQISQLYNPVSANTFMYNLFQRLQSLKPGNYFLSHTAGENASVISQAIPENSHPLAFDLKKMYPEKIPNHIPKEIPWVPLDPNVLMNFHEHYGRIPCTFHPRDFVNKTGNFKSTKKKKKKKT